MGAALREDAPSVFGASSWLYHRGRTWRVLATGDAREPYLVLCGWGLALRRLPNAPGVLAFFDWSGRRLHERGLVVERAPGVLESVPPAPLARVVGG